MLTASLLLTARWIIAPLCQQGKPQRTSACVNAVHTQDERRQRRQRSGADGAKRSEQEQTRENRQQKRRNRRESGGGRPSRRGGGKRSGRRGAGEQGPLLALRMGDVPGHAGCRYAVPAHAVAPKVVQGEGGRRTESKRVCAHTTAQCLTQLVETFRPANMVNTVLPLWPSHIAVVGYIYIRGVT